MKPKDAYENKNCLKGMSCPKCGSSGPFRIASTCWAIVNDDGVEETTEFEWDDDSACRCVGCGHDAKVSPFCEEGRDVIHDDLTWEEALKEMEGDKAMLREMEETLLIDINIAVASSIKVANATGSPRDGSGEKALLPRLEDVQAKLKAMGEEVHPYDENVQL